MQKTVVFGRKPASQENLNPLAPSKGRCKNCEKLQAQIAELSLFNGSRQISVQHSESEGAVGSVREELLALREQYLALKNKLGQYHKENQEMEEENTKLTRHLKACQIELKELLKRKKEPLLLESDSEYVESEDEKGQPDQDETAGPSKFDHRQIISELEAQFQKEKQLVEMQVLVWKDKAAELEALTSDQKAEINKLKQLLRRRNKIQGERHSLLEAVCC